MTQENVAGTNEQTNYASEKFIQVRIEDSCVLKGPRLVSDRDYIVKGIEIPGNDSFGRPFGTVNHFFLPYQFTKFNLEGQLAGREYLSESWEKISDKAKSYKPSTKPTEDQERYAQTIIGQIPIAHYKTAFKFSHVDLVQKYNEIISQNSKLSVEEAFEQARKELTPAPEMVDGLDRNCWNQRLVDVLKKYNEKRSPCTALMIVPGSQEPIPTDIERPINIENLTSISFEYQKPAETAAGADAAVLDNIEIQTPIAVPTGADAVLADLPLSSGDGMHNTAARNVDERSYEMPPAILRNFAAGESLEAISANYLGRSSRWRTLADYNGLQENLDNDNPILQNHEKIGIPPLAYLRSKGKRRTIGEVLFGERDRSRK